MKTLTFLRRMLRRRGSRRGFTLMEVAIAMAVVVIGCLALFSLIGSGLDSSAKAVADTHAAAFARSVFSILRARSLEQAQSGVTGAWENFWNDVLRGTNFPVEARDVWIGQREWIGSGRDRRLVTNLTFVTDGTVRTVKFNDRPLHAPDVTNVVNAVLRYRLTPDLLYPVSTLWTNRAMVTLDIWEGEFGNTNVEEALTYYSEFDNPGDL